jgi:hypothetical protein
MLFMPVRLPIIVMIVMLPAIFAALIIFIVILLIVIIPQFIILATLPVWGRWLYPAISYLLIVSRISIGISQIDLDSLILAGPPGCLGVWVG